MDLVIEIGADGKPVNHPIFLENLRMAFPNLDLNNLPEKYQKFVRVPQNVTPGVFEVVNEPEYVKKNGVWQDFWSIRPMNADEIAAKKAKISADFMPNIDSLKKITNEKIASAVTENQKEAWRYYMQILENFVITDWSNPQIPNAPDFDQNGNWIR